LGSKVGGRFDSGNGELSVNADGRTLADTAAIIGAEVLCKFSASIGTTDDDEAQA